ncbi:ankyrin repeat-containing domain protein [Mycena albidolilacea]|uniref:Ankyrin repeat-containing domain protein n=1 Tax=Mycena albidolilacea TaxID=1033008 RepID=A0AAD7EGK3_9AGAR|nr:ankyrin repeat-containing domain protein [Mycena albidolilacea]
MCIKAVKQSFADKLSSSIAIPSRPLPGVPSSRASPPTPISRQPKVKRRRGRGAPAQLALFNASNIALALGGFTPINGTVPVTIWRQLTGPHPQRAENRANGPGWRAVEQRQRQRDHAGLRADQRVPEERARQRAGNQFGVNPDLAVAGILRLSTEERTKIIEWLSPINFFLRHADISSERQKNTGGWLLVHPLFKEWESGSERTLWCRGIHQWLWITSGPNTKTKDLAKNSAKKIGVACIYLNHKEAEDQTPAKFLSGLWRQLVLGRHVGTHAKTLYERHKEKRTALALEEVVHVLRSSLLGLSKFYIIVDAVDEYPEIPRRVLLHRLAAVGSNINLMLTSRPHIRLEPIFPNLETLDICAMPEDIQQYVDAQINMSPRLSKHVQSQPDLRKAIHSKISSHTLDGMFLLAKLHIESLSIKNTIKAVQEALRNLPKNLNDSYDIAIQRIETQNEEDRKTARSALIWVALAIEPGTKCLDNNNLLDIDIILSVCAGLVVVPEQHSVVRLVHYTTQEYLDSVQAQLFPDAQTEITQTLLTFLAFDGFPHSSWKWSDPPPLVEYSQYCLVHAAGQPEVQLRSMIQKFLGHANQWKKVMSSGQSLWNSLPWNSTLWPSQTSTLWIAVVANLVETAKFLLAEATLLKYSYGPETVVASYYGHLLMVQLLIDNEAASFRGHEDIVQLLLVNGADANAAGKQSASALDAAISIGHEILLGCSLRRVPIFVRLLIDNGADLNAQGPYGTPLEVVSSRGHEYIARLLIENGADVNVEIKGHPRLLTKAASNGYENFVRLFIDNGADLNAQGPDGTALTAASLHGHVNIVKLLLVKGADVNTPGKESASALHTAISIGHENIARLLMEHGADLGVEVKSHPRLLTKAASTGHKNFVHLLIDNGARWDSIDSSIAPWPREHCSVAAKRNASGGHLDSALVAAVSNSNENIAQLLIENGAEVNLHLKFDGTVLARAAYFGHAAVVQLLIDSGADPVDYRTALVAAACAGHNNIVQLLVNNGADVNGRDKQYGSAIEAASKRGYKSMVQMLLRNGARM